MAVFFSYEYVFFRTLAPPYPRKKTRTSVPPKNKKGLAKTNPF